MELDNNDEKLNIENTDTIDGMAYEQDTSSLILLLADGMDWSDIAEHLGQEAIKDKAHQIYVGLSDEVKEQIVQYQNGARNKTWMLNRCNLKYIVDNDIYLQ